MVPTGNREQASICNILCGLCVYIKIVSICRTFKYRLNVAYEHMIYLPKLLFLTVCSGSIQRSPESPLPGAIILQVVWVKTFVQLFDM